MIKAAEPTKQNATLGRARENLSAEKIFGGDVNEKKRGPQKISGECIPDTKQRSLGALRRGFLMCRGWKRCMSLNNRSGDEAGKGNVGGKVPTVGQRFVTTGAMLQRDNETAYQHRQDTSLSTGQRENVQKSCFTVQLPRPHSPRPPAGFLKQQLIISGSWEWGEDQNQEHQITHQKLRREVGQHLPPSPQRGST